jgi:hypothetical protein
MLELTVGAAKATDAESTSAKSTAVILKTDTIFAAWFGFLLERSTGERTQKNSCIHVFVVAVACSFTEMKTASLHSPPVSCTGLSVL